MALCDIERTTFVTTKFVILYAWH